MTLPSFDLMHLWDSYGVSLHRFARSLVVFAVEQKFHERHLSFVARVLAREYLMIQMHRSVFRMMLAHGCLMIQTHLIRLVRVHAREYLMIQMHRSVFRMMLAYEFLMIQKYLMFVPQIPLVFLLPLVGI